jgi:hypothetical protein
MGSPFDILRKVLIAGGTNPLRTPSGLDDLQIKQNFMLPEPGTPGFFGQHPNLSRGIENAFLMAANTPSGATVGENISNIARAALGLRSIRDQHIAEQTMIPLQWRKMQMDMEGKQAEIEKNRAAARIDNANAAEIEGLGNYSATDHLEANLSTALGFYPDEIKNTMRARVKEIDLMPAKERPGAAQRMYEQSTEQYRLWQQHHDAEESKRFTNADARAAMVAANVLPEGTDPEFTTRVKAKAYLSQRTSMLGAAAFAQGMGRSQVPGVMSDSVKDFNSKQEDDYNTQMRGVSEALKDPFQAFIGAKMGGTLPPGINDPKAYGQYLQKEQDALRKSWAAYKPGLGITFSQFHGARSSSPVGWSK